MTDKLEEIKLAYEKADAEFCEACGKSVMHSTYCDNCGQKLWWSE